MPRRERSPPPPVPPIPALFRHAYAGIGPSNIPAPSTPSNSSPNDHANSLRKAKSAVEMSSAYERKRRTALPPSKLRESVSANEGMSYSLILDGEVADVVRLVVPRHSTTGPTLPSDYWSNSPCSNSHGTEGQAPENTAR